MTRIRRSELSAEKSAIRSLYAYSRQRRSAYADSRDEGTSSGLPSTFATGREMVRRNFGIRFKRCYCSRLCFCSEPPWLCLVSGAKRQVLLCLSIGVKSCEELWPGASDDRTTAEIFFCRSLLLRVPFPPPSVCFLQACSRCLSIAQSCSTDYTTRWVGLGSSSFQALV